MLQQSGKGSRSGGGRRCSDPETHAMLSTGEEIDADVQAGALGAGSGGVKRQQEQGPGQEGSGLPQLEVCKQFEPTGMERGVALDVLGGSHLMSMQLPDTVPVDGLPEDGAAWQVDGKDAFPLRPSPLQAPALLPHAPAGTATQPSQMPFGVPKSMDTETVPDSELAWVADSQAAGPANCQ
eukprot:scaffold286232_cov19-Tisochrysis_lutea.AAC.1